METDRWQRLQELFEGAMEVPAERRSEWLAEACPDDAELRGQAESLIRNDAQSTVLGGAIREAASAYSAMWEPGSGDRLGPYRVVRLLGRGGMGAVFLAERDDDQFQMTVAIKLVASNALTPDMQERFKTERQILASLDHPNIARLLDGGAATNGTPYVVIEYIDGQPITEYCRQNDLSIRDRVGLFRKVCAAVHYAHQNLVVHRDLKPGNILVTKDGEPKLLDFGIAKLLNPAAPSQTQTRARLMTPEYASPEQVRGQQVTTATDVYALGVLLYELLTGELPYKVADMDPHAVEQAICTAEPVRPSSVREELRGDVENILLMALRKEPARRYPSAEQLSEDLRRYLDGYPVAAREDSWRYRADKFVRRNRAAVTAAATAVLLVVAFAITMAVQANRIARERDTATLERQKSEQVSAFLTDLFTSADPSRSKGATITAREILDNGAQRLQKELAGQPELQATMLTQIGTVYQSLGLYDSARANIESGLAVRRRVFGERNAEVAASLANLASVRRDLGDHENALKDAQQSLALRRELGSRGRDLVQSLNAVAIMLEDKADYAQSEQLNREAISEIRSQANPDLTLLATSLNNLAGLLQRMGRDSEVLPILQDALDMRRKALGSEHPATIQTLNNVGNFHMRHREFEEAEKAYRDVLALRTKVFGSDHPEVAKAMTNLSNVLVQKKQYDEAVALLTKAEDIFRKRLGEKHLNVAFVMDTLALVHFQKKDYQRADSYYRGSMEMFRAQFGPDHPEVALSYYNLAGNYDAWEKFAEAEEFVRMAERVYRTKTEERGRDRLKALVRLGAILKERDKLQEAEATYRQVLELGRDTWKADDEDRAFALGGLGEVVTVRGQAREGEPILREAVGIQRKVYAKDDGRLAITENALGACLAALGRGSEAEPLLVSSLAVMRTDTGEASRQTRLAQERLARLRKGDERARKE